MAVAILDSDYETVNILGDLVAEMGQTPETTTNKDKFLEIINPETHTIAIISDEFIDALEGTKQVYPQIEFIAIGCESKSECIRLGATHYLEKPFKAEDMIEALSIVINYAGTMAVDHRHEFITADPSMQPVVEIMKKVAPTQAPVLIQGESGTGKEVIARFLHSQSKRAKGPYIGINLAAIPDTLLESELFGYEKGAFTGAYATRIGKFEQAQDGTILLDEITEISLGMQAKLLRVLQEKQIDRVGGKTPVAVNFRVIATTNRDVETEIAEGRFRKDLFFRLNVIPITVPALRSRTGDILPLALHFIKKVAKRENIKDKTLCQEAKNALLNYAWPGNVRELENIIERAMILSDGPQIDVSAILPGIESQPLTSQALTPGCTISEMEKSLIVSTLDSVSGNRTKAAQLLGISIRTLRNKLNEYKQKSQFSDSHAVKISGI